MTFTPDIPRTGQTLGNSRPQVVGNFTTIHRAFSVDSGSGTQTGDHWDYDTSNEGKHYQVRLPTLGSAPTTAALEGAIYTKDVGSGVVHPFFRRESNGSEFDLLGFSLIDSGVVALTTTNALFGTVPANSRGLFILQQAGVNSGFGYWYSDGTQAFNYTLALAETRTAVLNVISSSTVLPQGVLRLIAHTTNVTFNGNYNFRIYTLS